VTRDVSYAFGHIFGERTGDRTRILLETRDSLSLCPKSGLQTEEHMKQSITTGPLGTTTIGAAGSDDVTRTDRTSRRALTCPAVRSDWYKYDFRRVSIHA